MALDLKANWNVEIIKPPTIVTVAQSAKSGRSPSKPVCADLMQTMPSTHLALPLELLIQILDYLPQGCETQYTLWACSLVSRAWYEASIQRLYSSPYLKGGNFDLFVQTICPSKNAHITHSALASLVRSLDMRRLVHEPTRSLTARILGRLKNNLESFVAPQASFAINCFAALSKCRHLKWLDLSLVSATISSELLFKTLRSLHNLETFMLPRCSTTALLLEKHCVWPPKLHDLHLAGPLGGAVVAGQTTKMPNSLTSLKLQNCSNISEQTLRGVLQKIGPQLKNFSLQHPISGIMSRFLDDIFLICPNLLSLAVSADYLSTNFWINIPQGYPLRAFEVDISPMAKFEDFVVPADFYIPIEEGRLPDLRQIKFSKRFNWIGGSQRQYKDCMSLIEILEANEKERPLGMVTGLWPLND